jgi:hypothetical protein
LKPGGLMYDAAHVRSALWIASFTAQPVRSATAIGGWTGHGPDGTLGAPDYSHAPPLLRLRDPSNDPLPPTRAASQASLYYAQSSGFGFVMQSNRIVEDFDPAPDATRLESAVDTVYGVSGGPVTIPSAPVMLYYHGREIAPFVYSGFELWMWTRADCQALVDFVLGDIWKLTRSGPRALRVSSAPGASSSTRPRSLPTASARK